MICGNIILEDSVIHFVAKEDGDVTLTIGDNMTGISKTKSVTFEQLGAIIGTSICGVNDAIMTAAAPLVKEAIGDWPKELQPSPVC